MRILFAADVPADPNSGAAGTEYQTIAALRKMGHEVDCIWAEDLPHRIHHGNLHFLLELPYAYRTAIRPYASRQNYDVYHVNQPHCWLAARDHQRSGRPGIFVQRSHGWELRSNEALDYWRRRWRQPDKRFPYSIPSRILRRLLDRHNHLAARWCDGTIVYCQMCKQYIVSRHRIAPERVAAIAAAPTDDALQGPLPCRTIDACLRILYVSQFAYFKAPEIVAEAMRRIAEGFPQASFTWVCDSSHHGAVRALLGPAAPRVMLLGWMPQTKLLDVYDEHGIFLFPSLFEGFGKVFLEAMARGLCVVASLEGGMVDVIDSGVNGFLCPVGDASALAAAATAVMRDKELFAKVSHAARQTALTYSWERAARETVAFYERLIARRMDPSGAPNRLIADPLVLRLPEKTHR